MSRKKILVVDDSKSIVNMLTLKLTAEGFEVCSAPDGVEAIAQAIREKPLAIVMDVLMPKMSGFEALQKLRFFPETRNIPVIIISAKVGMEDFFENIPDVEFMPKPIDLDLLVLRLEALTTGAQSLREQSFRMIDANVYFQNLSEERVCFDILKCSAESSGRKFVCNSLSPEDWSLVLSLVRTEERIVPFFGIHPWYSEAAHAKWDSELIHILINQKGAGVGAIGLDRSPKGDDYTKQRKIFFRQLQIAAQLSRPVAICCDQAWDDLLDFLHYQKPAHVRVMIHDFQGSPAVLEPLIGLGAYIAFSRKTLKEADALTLELVRKVPKDKLLLETNFPSVNAQKSKAGVSAEVYLEWLRETYALAALATKTDPNEIEKTVWENGHMFLYGVPSEKYFG